MSTDNCSQKFIEEKNQDPQQQSPLYNIKKIQLNIYL